MVSREPIYCNAPESDGLISTLHVESEHHPTYAFVLASRKTINLRMVDWTLKALYDGLTHLCPRFA